MAPVGPAVGGAVGIVAAVLFFTVTVVTLCRVILWKNRKTPNPTSNKHPALQINNVSFLAYPGPPMPELPPPAPETCSEGFNPPLANLQPSFSSSPNPPLPSLTPDPPKLKHPCAWSALIIYSPLCPDKDRRTLMQYLINDLREYDIRTVAHDCDYTKGSLSQWLETEVKRASAVLCVCDPAFLQEWEQQQPTDTNFPLVYSLKLLVYANVNRGEELSKYAIVLLRKEDRDCIPTYYLNNTRTFYVNEIENIAHFVQQVPAYSYEWHSPCTFIFECTVSCVMIAHALWFVRLRRIVHVIYYASSHSILKVIALWCCNCYCCCYCVSLRPKSGTNRCSAIASRATVTGYQRPVTRSTPALDAW